MKKILWTILFLLALWALFSVVKKVNAPAPYVPSENTTEDILPANPNFPETLNTKYITAVDWPPATNVMDEPYSCTEAGVDTERAGGTKKEDINGREYCVTKVSDGAAGSTYTQYAYATAEGNDKTKIFTFTLRFVQCMNYDDPEQAECLSERDNFSPDSFFR